MLVIHHYNDFNFNMVGSGKCSDICLDAGIKPALDHVPT